MKPNSKEAFPTSSITRIIVKREITSIVGPQASDLEIYPDIPHIKILPLVAPFL